MSDSNNDSNYATIKSEPIPAHLPSPAHLPMPVAPGAEPDPTLTQAWREHMVENFENNQQMFQSTLRAFRAPYWMTVIMYGTLFLIGIAAFIMAIYFSLSSGGDGGNGDGGGSGISMTLLFGGLSVASFLAFFIRQPLHALEDNLKFSAWMGGIYNTYWTQLMYAQDPNTVQTDIRQASEDFNLQMERLIRLHTDLRQERPGQEVNEVPRIGQPFEKSL